jgi:hypothetical protein
MMINSVIVPACFWRGSERSGWRRSRPGPRSSNNNKKDVMQLIISNGRSPQSWREWLKRWPGSWDRRQICSPCIHQVQIEEEIKLPSSGAFLAIPVFGEYGELCRRYALQLAHRTPKQTWKAVLSLHAFSRVIPSSQSLHLVPSVWHQELNWPVIYVIAALAYLVPTMRRSTLPYYCTSRVCSLRQMSRHPCFRI